MILEQIADPRLAQYAYLIGCQETGQAIVIDPQRDIERYLEVARERELTLVAAAETHIHADYLSGLRQFAHRTGNIVYASGERRGQWGYDWLEKSPYHHRLLRNGDSIRIGQVRLDVLHTPGHTPEHISYLLTDLARDSDHPLAFISGDFVFVGDVGRPDLLGLVAGWDGTAEESARELFESLQMFTSLSPSLMLLPGHGAGSACGKSLGAVPISTVGYELQTNLSLRMAAEADGFIDFILTGQPEPPPYFVRMKEENRKGPAILDAMPEPQPIPAADIHRLVRDRECAFVDTRKWEEYQAGHLPGSLFAPLEKQFTTIVGSYIGADEPICLIAEPDRITEAVTDCIRIGLDRFELFVTPGQLRQYAESGAPMATTEQIEMARLPHRLSAGHAVALDVRRAAEIEETGRIDGSYNIAHTHLTLRHRELPQGHDILVFCNSGNRSRFACGILEKLGYRAILVDGGIDAWKRIKGPLVAVENA
jgi:hydroxyacylglutathione hydrolase